MLDLISLGLAIAAAVTSLGTCLVSTHIRRVSSGCCSVDMGTQTPSPTPTRPNSIELTGINLTVKK